MLFKERRGAVRSDAVKRRSRRTKAPFCSVFVECLKKPTRSSRSLSRRSCVDERYEEIIRGIKSREVESSRSVDNRQKSIVDNQESGSSRRSKDVDAKKDAKSKEPVGYQQRQSRSLLMAVMADG